MMGLFPNGVADRALRMARRIRRLLRQGIAPLCALLVLSVAASHLAPAFGQAAPQAQFKAPPGEAVFIPGFFAQAEGTLHFSQGLKAEIWSANDCAIETMWRIDNREGVNPLEGRVPLARSTTGSLQFHVPPVSYCLSFTNLGQSTFVGEYRLSH
jgi:hypothetical protein